MPLPSDAEILAAVQVVRDAEATRVAAEQAYADAQDALTAAINGVDAAHRDLNDLLSQT